MTTWRCLPLACFLLVATSHSGASAADTWLELESDNFTVITNAGERRARNVAFQFEQVRAATRSVFSWARVELDRPIVVIAAKDENTMRALAPQYWEVRNGTRPSSVFASGADRLTIALRADLEVEGQIVNPYNAAFWSYSALVLQNAFTSRLPLWLHNGLASVLANTVVQNKEVQIGRPLPWVAQQAATGRRLPLATLLGMSGQDPYYTDGETRNAFDAQSWSLVQFMIFGGDDSGAKLNDVVNRVLAGARSDAAISEVYGSLDALDDASRLYAQRGIYKFGRVPVSVEVSVEQSKPRELSVAEATAARAAFHVVLGRSAEARALLAEARKADPASPVIDETEARLLDREKRPDDARALYEKAIAAGSKDFYAYYRLAQMTTMTARSAEAVDRLAGLYDKSLAINPKFWPALQVAATIALQANRSERALDLATRLVQAQPNHTMHRLTLARAQVQLQKLDEAEKTARDARPLARTTQEQAAVDSLLSTIATMRAR